MAFTLPTYLDEHPEARGTMVRCACGRSVNPDMLIRVQGEFRCDSCREHGFTTGALDRVAFYREHNAPAALVTKAARLAAERGEGLRAGGARAVLPVRRAGHSPPPNEPQPE